MEFGRFLYEMYKQEIAHCTTDPIDEWDDLNIAVKAAWDGLAKRIKAGEEI